MISEIEAKINEILSVLAGVPSSIDACDLCGGGENYGTARLYGVDLVDERHLVVCSHCVRSITISPKYHWETKDAVGEMGAKVVWLHMRDKEKFAWWLASRLKKRAALEAGQ